MALIDQIDPALAANALTDAELFSGESKIWEPKKGHQFVNHDFFP